MHSIHSVLSGANRLDLESSKQKMQIQSVKSVKGTEAIIGYRGGVIRLVVLVCGSFLGVGPSFGDHVDYFLQLFFAVFLESVRLVLEGVW